MTIGGGCGRDGRLKVLCSNNESPPISIDEMRIGKSIGKMEKILEIFNASCALGSDRRGGRF